MRHSLRTRPKPFNGPHNWSLTTFQHAVEIETPARRGAGVFAGGTVKQSEVKHLTCSVVYHSVQALLTKGTTVAGYCILPIWFVPQYVVRPSLDI